MLDMIWDDMDLWINGFLILFFIGTLVNLKLQKRRKRNEKKRH